MKGGIMNFHENASLVGTNFVMKFELSVAGVAECVTAALVFACPF